MLFNFDINSTRTSFF